MATALTQVQVNLANNAGFDVFDCSFEEAQKIVQRYYVEEDGADYMDQHDMRVLTAFGINPVTFEVK